MFFDPRFRTLYPSLMEAPRPKKDGEYIAVEVDGDRWCQDYVSTNGRWMRYGLPFLLQQWPLEK